MSTKITSPSIVANMLLRKMGGTSENKKFDHHFGDLFLVKEKFSFWFAKQGEGLIFYDFVFVVIAGGFVYV